jgi:hypothetical protein
MDPTPEQSAGLDIHLVPYLHPDGKTHAGGCSARRFYRMWRQRLPDYVAAGAG